MPCRAGAFGEREAGPAACTTSTTAELEESVARDVVATGGWGAEAEWSVVLGPKGRPANEALGELGWQLGEISRSNCYNTIYY